MISLCMKLVNNKQRYTKILSPLGEITRKLVAIIMTKTKSASRNAMLFLLLSARFGERHEGARGRERSSPRTGPHSTTFLSISNRVCFSVKLKYHKFY